jgi:hypothetical protein
MRFFIKEYPDDTVMLLTEDGRVVWTFESVEAAIAGCRDWDGPFPAQRPARSHIRTEQRAIDIAA